MLNLLEGSNPSLSAQTGKRHPKGAVSRFRNTPRRSLNLRHPDVPTHRRDMAEHSADAAKSKATLRADPWVQIPPSPPKQGNGTNERCRFLDSAEHPETSQHSTCDPGSAATIQVDRAGTRRRELITHDNPPGSQSRPSPSKGDRAPHQTTHHMRPKSRHDLVPLLKQEPSIQSPFQGEPCFSPPLKGDGRGAQRRCRGIPQRARPRNIHTTSIPGAQRRCSGIGRHTKTRADHARQSPWLASSPVPLQRGTDSTPDQTPQRPKSRHDLVPLLREPSFSPPFKGSHASVPL